MFLRVFMASAGGGFLLGLAGLMSAGADAGSAAFITAASAGPAILAGALSAGQMARVGARAQPPWPRETWARRGAGFGAVSGGAWLVLWLVAFNLPAGIPPLVSLAGTLVVGAAAGSLIGLVVGLYCARMNTATRRSFAILVLLAAAPPAIAQPTQPLQVVVAPAQQAMTARHITFHITLRNVSDAPLLLNGGVVLGNGRHAWSAIECTLRGRAGRPVSLGLHWRLGGVGGRMYTLGVALGPGDTHTIAVTPDDYASPTALALGPNELQCRFTGRPSNDSEWPQSWVGAAVSAPARIEITNEPATPRADGHPNAAAPSDTRRRVVDVASSSRM